jgi:ribonucleotide monophosphatase NagD (HAD superfamily)
MALASAMRGSLVPRERVVVIGDSGRTDIGVNGFDALFVTSGIHAQELFCFLSFILVGLITAGVL